MLKISKQQLFQRWDVLPDNLREALFSETNADIFWRICQAEHISEEKISIGATIVGDVILGFLHVEDLAKELQLDLNINKEIASVIAREVDRKIFSLIRSDLEKIYSPVALDTVDLRKPENKGEEIKLMEKTGGEKSVSLETPKPQVPGSAIASESAATFDLKEDEASSFASAVAETMADKEAMEDKPAIIHKEEGIKPISKFKASFGGLFGIGKGTIKEEQKSEPKSVIAKVEMEIPEEAKKQFEEMEIARTEEPKFKIVHYTSAENLRPTTYDLRPITNDLQPTIYDQQPQPTIDDQPQVAEQGSLRGGQPAANDLPIDTVILEAPELPKSQEFKPEKIIIKDYITENALEDQQGRIEDTVVLKKPENPIPKEINPEEMKLEDIPVSEDTIDLREMSK